jgi:hypothetical protein
MMTIFRGMMTIFRWRTRSKHMTARKRHGGRHPIILEIKGVKFVCRHGTPYSHLKTFTDQIGKTIKHGDTVIVEKPL